MYQHHGCACGFRGGPKIVVFPQEVKAEGRSGVLLPEQKVLPLFGTGFIY